MIHTMKKLFESFSLLMSKLLPIILITLSIYLYKGISDENKKLKDRIETLTSLVSYKTSEILEIIKETENSKK